jgi:hypothetical protein
MGFGHAVEDNRRQRPVNQKPADYLHIKKRKLPPWQGSFLVFRGLKIFGAEAANGSG